MRAQSNWNHAVSPAWTRIGPVRHLSWYRGASPASREDDGSRFSWYIQGHSAASPCEAALAINRASSHLKWVGQDEDCQQMDEMLPARRGLCGFDVFSRSRAASAADFSAPLSPRQPSLRSRHGLVEDSRRLIEAIQLESGNAPWEQRLKVRAIALLKAAEQLERGQSGWPRTPKSGEGHSKTCARLTNPLPASWPFPRSMHLRCGGSPSESA